MHSKNLKDLSVKELLHVFTYHNLSNTDSAEDRFIQKHGASETKHLFGLFTNKATNIGEKKHYVSCIKTARLQANKWNVSLKTL